jgi:arylsulfatase A-like enzyme
MSTIDILPTFAKLAQAKLPTDRILDGKDIWPTLLESAKTPHKAFFYKNRAIRLGDWKLHLKGEQPKELYNLKQDVSEKKNVLKQYPEIAERLTKVFKTHLKEISENKRPAAYVKKASALKK